LIVKNACEKMKSTQKPVAILIKRGEF